MHNLISQNVLHSEKISIFSVISFPPLCMYQGINMVDSHLQSGILTWQSMEIDCQLQVAIQGLHFLLHLWFGFIFAAL